ncbi:MAG: hypothetical protein ABJP02_12730 [Parasphingorhabdus sp.]|uniref:hypothetical protein n=1 Tax=Parasphingorhabdus sp. TaxID=2709688 RepID=UPI003297F1A0
MRNLWTLVIGLALLSACSDAPSETEGEEEVTAIEKQIEGDAKSLEAAADEAVKELKSEIEADLSDDGVSTPDISAPTTS